MKFSLGNTIGSHPQLRHRLVVAVIILVLIIALFAWDSAAQAWGA